MTEQTETHIKVIAFAAVTENFMKERKSIKIKPQI
jgi:hypothetical protein